METEFKVGDKVKEMSNNVLGIGVIESISDHDLYYPISVRYGCGALLSYALDGERYKGITNTPYIEKIKEHIWELGQKVFSARYGWGVVDSFILNDSYPLVVYFNVEVNYKIRYNLDGLEDYYNDRYPTLSFTNYILDKFSQDPKDAIYEDSTLTFDWKCLPDWANKYIAKDDSGTWYCYEHKPIKKVGAYHKIKGDMLHIPQEFYPKNNNRIDWSNSLYKNPQYK